MDMNELLRLLGLRQAYDAYQRNIGQPVANVAGPFGRGLLGLDRPEYGKEEAYRTGQAVGNMPAVAAPVGLLKAAAQAPDVMKAAQALPEATGLLGAAVLHGSPVSRVTNLSDIENKFKDVILDVYEKNGTINLSRIVVPKEMRSSGVGSSVMNDLTSYADSTGQKIALTPSGDFGGNVNRLKDFYKRFGFVENKGKNKDFSIKETMIRFPE